MKKHFDVIVIGAGHAGAEAAYAAAQLGSSVALITLDVEKVSTMPCNPSIGGLGKGHIVFEIAALGGLMPQLCSKTYLQARMLNTSKGPAVQGLRLQIDKFAYTKLASEVMAAHANIQLISGMVDELVVSFDQEGKKIVEGVVLESGEHIYGRAVVITTGTFLNGRIHVGAENYEGGPYGERSATKLSGSLAELLGTKLGRLKTGTPPRLLTASIDFSKLELQHNQPLEYLYEFDAQLVQDKSSCYIAQTNEKTHEVIEKNLFSSAMYSGNIKGVGPRYCPSIEDKIGRFPDRKEHHVFIEPEGYNSDEVYPAGISTSLPKEIQEQYVRTIVGLEKAIITKFGYAIEYDFLQPTHLIATLETKAVSALFCAGQINGTTGYEEAAGQGILAGINAHLKAHGKEPFILSRTESYIGVMVDDLITLGVDEPYRMFTSRAERRLILRQDNVFARLIPHAYRLGLIDDSLHNKFLEEEAVVKAALHIIESDTQRNLFSLFHVYEFFGQAQECAREALSERLIQKNISIDALSSRALLRIHAEVKYAGYIKHEKKEVEKLVRYKHMKIPDTFIYENLPGLSVELMNKLLKHQPVTIADAQLIPGMTPAALSILIFRVQQSC